MLLLQLPGLALLCLAAWQAIRMWMLDRALQRYRDPAVSSAAYMLVPLRWQRRLYTPEGEPLVKRAWRAMLSMYASALAGMVLLAIASAAG